MLRQNKVNFAFFRQRESLWVLLLFVLLTIIAAWNIVTDLNSVIIGFDNDVFINPWADWWTYKAITDPDISLWRSDYLYFPIGADLIYHSFSHLNTAVSLILQQIINPLPAYNITILINYILAGWGMYLFSRYQTGSSIAGILAGIVFAYNSHNLYQSSHPVLVSVWCFPLITLYFFRAIKEINPKLALLAAFFVFLGASTSTVLVILIIFWIGLLLIYLFITKQLPTPTWRIVVIFGFMSAIFIFPTVYALLADAITADNVNFIINPEESLRTDLINPILPHWHVWLKRGMYLGIMPFFLIMLAIGRKRKEAKVWAIFAIVIFLFAIGPEPEFVHQKLGFVLPWTTPIAPILRNMYRMMILWSFTIALLVGYGWLGLTQSIGNSTRRLALTAIFVGALIFLEYTLPPFPGSPVTASEFYSDYLQNVPDDVVIAALPTGRQEGKHHMYYQTIHGHPMTSGVISRAGSNVFHFIETNSLLRAGAVNLPPVPFPENSEAALAELASNNVGFVVIDKALLIQANIDETTFLTVEDWRAFMPNDPIYEDNLLLVFPTSTEFVP